MLRLTLMLSAAIAVAMIVGGRDLAPDEMARLTQPAPQTRGLEPVPAAAAVLAQPALAVPSVAPPPARDVLTLDPGIAVVAAGDRLELAAPAATEAVISGDAVRSAVEQALAGTTAAALVVAEPEAPAPSVADEIAAALSDSQVWYVNGERVNVRQGPSTEYSVIGQVEFGDATEILSDPDDAWVHIRIQGDGLEGYIARKFLQDSEPNG